MLSGCLTLKITDYETSKTFTSRVPCLLPTFLGAQGVASASFLEITPDAQSAGMAGTGLAITDNGSTAIFHNASTIAFSQDVMGASYSYADINKDFGMHSASLFYRIGREGKHGFSVGFRHYKDADFHWQDGAEDHARAWNVEAAYFRNVAKNLVPFINTQISAGKSL